MVKKITNNDMTEALGEGLAFVDFSATWCGPCKMLAPIFHELADSTEGVGFYQVDIDENDDLAMKYQVQSVPTLLAFKNGELAGKSVGFQPKTELEKWMNSLK